MIFKHCCATGRGFAYLISKKNRLQFTKPPSRPSHTQNHHPLISKLLSGDSNARSRRKPATIQLSVQFSPRNGAATIRPVLFDHYDFVTCDFRLFYTFKHCHGRQDRSIVAFYCRTAAKGEKEIWHWRNVFSLVVTHVWGKYVKYW